MPATLARHLGLRELVDRHVNLGDAPGRANVGHKAMTIVHSALAGGDSIDDADALRAGDTQSVLGHAVLAPSTLGCRSVLAAVVRIADYDRSEDPVGVVALCARTPAIRVA